MKLRARACGGFAGLERSWEGDTAHMPDGAALEALLERLDFFAAQPATAVGADLPRWDITVDDGRRCHTVSILDDGNAGEWRHLLEYLRRAA